MRNRPLPPAALPVDAGAGRDPEGRAGPERPWIAFADPSDSVVGPPSRQPPASRWMLGSGTGPSREWERETMTTVAAGIAAVPFDLPSTRTRPGGGPLSAAKARARWRGDRSAACPGTICEAPCRRWRPRFRAAPPHPASGRVRAPRDPSGSSASTGSEKASWSGIPCPSVMNFRGNPSFTHPYRSMSAQFRPPERKRGNAVTSVPWRSRLVALPRLGSSTPLKMPHMSRIASAPCICFAGHLKRFRKDGKWIF